MFRLDDKQTEPVVEVWSDSDWAGQKPGRKSTTGWVATINGNVVSWQSKLQSNVALSSSEAELYAANSAGTELMYLRGLLGELGLINTDTCGPSPIYMDNQSAMSIATNGVRSSERTKHIDVRHNWLTERVECGDAVLHWVSTQDQLADILTKSLEIGRAHV